VASPQEQDLRFGQIAVRMGMLPPQELPKLMGEAKAMRERARNESGTDAKRAGLGQLLVRKKLLTVSEYLYVAREVEKAQSGEETGNSLQALQDAIQQFEDGKGDQKSIETILSSEDLKIEVPSREEMPPTFGRYELLEEIARGGMGIVYRAKDTKTGAILALKVMIEADDDEARLQRFEREAELAKALDHPGIVKVYDAGSIDGMPYFTMDLVEGKSLDDLLDEGIDRFAAIDILAQTARAVDHAHKRGIVHRDLKPGNILVEKDGGRARVTDFGLARDMDRNTRITRVGQAVGTPYYMAPEQVRGERDVDGRSDTYAIGVILYEVLTGEVPFDADSALTLFKKIDREPVSLALDPEKGIDEKIHAITMRALQKKRDDRYATSKLLAEDLERYLKGVRPKARANTALDDLVLWTSTHRRSVILAAVALAVLVVLALVGSTIVRNVVEARQREAGQAAARALVERTGSLIENGEKKLEKDAAAAALDAEKARAELERALALARGDPPTPRALGAQEALRSAPALKRKTLWLLARAREAQGDAMGARLALEEGARASPGDREILLRLGALRRAAGDLEGAIAALTDALASVAGATGGAELSHAREVQARVARGEAYLDAARPTDAIRDLSLAIGEAPGPGTPTADRIRPLLLRARAYVLEAEGPAIENRGDALGEARKDAEAARDQAARAPEGANALLSAAYLALATVDRARAALETVADQHAMLIASALDMCQKAQEAAPDSPAPLIARGDLLLAHGDVANAAQSYDDAFAVAPGDKGFAALLGRGVARAHLFLLDDARADLEHAREAASRAPLAGRETRRSRDLLRARIAVELARVLEAQGDLAAARIALAEAAAPGVSAAPLVELALLDLGAGDAGKALTHLEAARALAPPYGMDAALLEEALARAYLVRGERERAIQEASVATARAGARPCARVRRASALVKLDASLASPGDERARDAAIESAQTAWSESVLLDQDAFDVGPPILDLATRLAADGEERALLARAAIPLGAAPAKLLSAAELRLAAARRIDPQRARASLALAELALARGDAAHALLAARHALAIDPFRARAEEVAAASLLETGDAAGALEAIGRARAIDGKRGDLPARLLLLARAHLAAGDKPGALEALDQARAQESGDDEAVEIDALAAAAAGGPDDALRVRKERSEARAQLLASALAEKDPDAARKAAEKLANARRAFFPETRKALLLEAQLAEAQPLERLLACARATFLPDPATLDDAHAVLASGWTTRPVGAQALAQLARRAASGDREAAVAFAFAKLEDAMTTNGVAAPLARDLLEPLEKARRAAPESLVPLLAHAALAREAGELVLAEADLTILRELGAESALLLRVRAKVARSRGDGDLGRELDERARRVAR
jgi:hypothetical protein